MTIRLFTTPRETGNLHLTGAVVVIDVFRATTTITTALANGARFVLPAADVEQAMKLFEPYGRREALLCGEREGIRIEGFDLGNSPAEYGPERVADRVIVFTSSNGTRAMLRAAGGDPVFLGSFLNVGALARALKTVPEVTLLCAGNGDRFSLEDFTCAGALISRLAPRAGHLSDAACAARAVYRSARPSLPRFLGSSEHALTLAGLGFGEDVETALKVDSAPLLPVLRGGRAQLLLEFP